MKAKNELATNLCQLAYDLEYIQNRLHKHRSF